MSKVIELLKKALKEKKLNDSYALYNVKEYINQALALLKKPECGTCDNGKIKVDGFPEMLCPDCQKPAKLKMYIHPYNGSPDTEDIEIIDGFGKPLSQEPAKPPDDETVKELLDIHSRMFARICKKCKEVGYGRPKCDGMDCATLDSMNAQEIYIRRLGVRLDEANKALQDKPSHSDLDAAIFENNLLQAQLKEQADEIEKWKKVNIHYETTIMATSPYLRHTPSCPLYEYVGLIPSPDAPECTCGLNQALKD